MSVGYRPPYSSESFLYRTKKILPAKSISYWNDQSIYGSKALCWTLAAFSVSWYCDVLVVHATNKMGSSSDDWFYEQLVTHSLLITLTYKQYSAIAGLHNLQNTVARALVRPVSTSRLPVTALNTQTIWVSHSKYSRRSILHNSRRELNWQLLTRSLL
jgi:hypothetical protein